MCLANNTQRFSSSIPTYAKVRPIDGPCALLCTIAVVGLPNSWGVCYLNAALLNLAYTQRWIIERLLLEKIDMATEVDGARVMELPRQLRRVGVTLMEVLVELRCNPRHKVSTAVSFRQFPSTPGTEHCLKTGASQAFLIVFSQISRA